MTQGLFITLEGGEGAGKSTQISLLAPWLAQQGHSITRTREPGGSPGAEEIRTLLVTGEAGRWDAITETALFIAARRDHWLKTIRPALQAGHIVLCDRYADSTRAYQGYGKGVDPALIESLSALLVGDAVPDLTLILDLPAAIGLARSRQRAQDHGHDETRFENLDLAFHERLRTAFHHFAATDPTRCKLIDASGTIDTVQTALREEIAARLAITGNAPPP